MSSGIRRTRRSRVAQLGTVLAVGGGICIVASVLIAFLVADHSSSDSSPSSLVAIGLGVIGMALVILGAAVRGIVSLAWLWHRIHRPAPGGSGGRQL